MMGTAASATPRLTQVDVLATLASASLFRTLDREALRHLTAAFTRVYVRAGDFLVRRGGAGDALYVVEYGRLRAILDDGSGTERVLGEVGRGETVGEMGVLTGEGRLSSVVALRDSALLRLTRAEFERLATAHPRVVLEMTRLLVTRYRESLRGSVAASVRTLIVLPSSQDAGVRAFVEELVQRLRVHAGSVLHVDAARADDVGDESGDREAALTAWLHDVELEHDVLVCEADPKPTLWTTTAVRQADTVLIVGSGDATPSAGPLAALAHARTGTVRPRAELVLLHGPGSAPSAAAAWLDAIPVDAHYHVTRGNGDDCARVARCLLGAGVGLVLGGGGARGLAHIGVLRAIEELRIPIDRIGGTSAGANIAAMYALGWSPDRILEETRRTFVDGGSLQDYTLPLHSLLRGERYHRIGEQLYGDRRIEDLTVPFFCVSTNLTRGEAYVHRRGLVRRALRASMTVPGIAPAVFEGREVLVDGGVINNVPVDIMRAQGAGPVIAVNVSPQRELRLEGDYSDTPSPWRTLLRTAMGQPNRIPTMAAVLTRAVTIPRAAIEADPRRRPDVLLEPPVAGFRLLQWSAIDALVEIGYRYALEHLADWRPSR